MQQRYQQMMSGIITLYRGLHDPKVPWPVKLLFFLVVIYVISPIDLIPDFIPVLGLLDEIVLVPLLVGYMLRLLPENTSQQNSQENILINTFWLRITGLALIISIWAGLAVICYGIGQLFL